MKDHSEETFRIHFEHARYQISEGCIKFCLSQLFADSKRASDEVIAGVCTYEELIGALLYAESEIEAAHEAMREGGL